MAEHKLGACPTCGRGGLSPRERQIAELIAQGEQNKAIAHILHLSIGTVKVNTSRLYQKLGFDTGNQRSRLTAWVLCSKRDKTDRK